MEQWDREEINSNVLVVYYGCETTASSSQSMTHTTDTASRSNGCDEESFSTVPQRVQINSNPLLSELEMIAGTSIGKAPVVMVPPFKFFVCKVDELAESLATKKEVYNKYLNSQEDTKQNGPNRIAPLTKEETEEEDKRKREKLLLDHLQVLVDFIKTGLTDILELRGKIKRAEIKTIAFDNLWHLFNPGDVVFVSERVGDDNDYLRAYRVTCVSGGRQSLHDAAVDTTQKAKSESKGDTSSVYKRNKLSLDCYYMDFDGEEFGPMDSVFHLKPYDGEQAITELDVWPVQFDPDHEEKLRQLRERGRRFKDLSHTFTKHKTYKGLTTGETEEVHGEVMIDFKTGYMFDREFQGTLGLLEVTSPTTDETGEHSLCKTRDCKGCTKNYPDIKFDWKRHEIFKRIHAHDLQLLDPEHENIPDNHLILLPRDVL